MLINFFRAVHPPSFAAGVVVIDCLHVALLNIDLIVNKKSEHDSLIQQCYCLWGERLRFVSINLTIGAFLFYRDNLQTTIIKG